MNLYKISQTVNNGYDTYDSAVVCAISKEKAKQIQPSTVGDWYALSWCAVKDVGVKYIGKAGKDIPVGVVMASFNAG